MSIVRLPKKPRKRQKDKQHEIKYNMKKTTKQHKSKNKIETDHGWTKTDYSSRITYKKCCSCNFRPEKSVMEISRDRTNTKQRSTHLTKQPLHCIMYSFFNLFNYSLFFRLIVVLFKKYNYCKYY